MDGSIAFLHHSACNGVELAARNEQTRYLCGSLHSFGECRDGACTFLLEVDEQTVEFAVHTGSVSSEVEQRVGNAGE